MDSEPVAAGLAAGLAEAAGEADGEAVGATAGLVAGEGLVEGLDPSSTTEYVPNPGNEKSKARNINIIAAITVAFSSGF